MEDQHFSRSTLSWGKWGSSRGLHRGSWNGRKGPPMQVLQLLVCVSQLQPDLTFSQVSLRSKELLCNVIDLFLSSSTEVLQCVHQCPFAPKMVNLPMELGIPFYHEGFVHRKLLRCSFLQFLPHGRCHVCGTSSSPPHIDWGRPNLMSLTVSPKDHGIIRRILDKGGQA